MVGRDVRLHVDRPPAHPGRCRAAGLRSAAARDAATRCTRWTQSRACGGARSSASAGSRATGRRSWSSASPVCGNPIPARSCWRAPRRRAGIRYALRDAGLSYIPEDRHGRGLVLPFSLTENMLLGNTHGGAFQQGRPDRLRGYARDHRNEMQKFDVRAPRPDTPAGSLSGGNQQKLIIARELHREPNVIWRSSRPAGSMSARSSSCTAARGGARQGTRRPC